MASTKRFTTGGGFPVPDSPGRQIEFTLSYGRSHLYGPTATEGMLMGTVSNFLIRKMPLMFVRCTVLRETKSA